MTSSDGSITKAVAGLQVSDEAAAQLIWDRFFSRLCQFAETRIYRRNKRHLEADDIAASAFMALVEGVREKRFEKVRNRDELWQMLILIAARKTINAQKHIDRDRRGGGNVQGDSAFGDSGIGSVVDFVNRDLDPQVGAQLQELSENLLAQLPSDELRKIALMRMAGHSNAEIAETLQCTTRTVERKLNLIRRLWSDSMPQ